MVLALAALWCIAVAHGDQASTNVITGTIEKVDSGTKTIGVKTADGTVETVKFTEETTVHGLKDAAKGGDLAGKEGGHVIVYTVGEGADKTARSVEWVGDKTVHTTEGNVEDVGKDSKTIDHGVIGNNEGLLGSVGRLYGSTRSHARLSWHHARSSAICLCLS